MRFTLLFAFPLLLFLMSCGPKPHDTPPNLLLIVADDLGYEKLSCYGGLGTKTPELDRMAARGMRFTHAYASAVCTPSRMSLYTGHYAPRHGFTDVLPVHRGSRQAVDFARWPTYAQRLRDQGYATAVTGKWQLAALAYHPEHCHAGGFDSWCVWQIWHDSAKTTRYWDHTYNQDGHIRRDARDRFGPDLLTDYVIDQMAQAQAEGRPFAIQHNMVLPHVPIVPTPEDQRQGREPSLDHLIGYLDQQVGRLLAAIDSLGLAENTVVLFVGDNGTQASEPRPTAEGLVTGGKWQLNHGGTHVPLIAYAPGRMAPGQVVHDLVDFADFYPTLCELAGVASNELDPVDGVSFAPTLLGQGPSPRRWITASFQDDYCVFDGQWRLHHQDQKLYDCRQLPLEQEADPDDPDAQAARERLRSILDEVGRSPIP